MTRLAGGRRAGARRPRRVARLAAAAVAALLALLAFAAPAVAGGRSGGFRSFSGGLRGYSGGSRGIAPARATAPRPTAPRPGRAVPAASGYSGEGRSLFSTPRDARGAAFSTTPGPFSRPREGPGSALRPPSSDRPAYGGTGNTRERVLRGPGSGRRDLAPAAPPQRGYDPGGSTAYPWRPPIVIYGGGFPPVFYHDWYWGMPWWQRIWWSPTFYGGWGYHYFLPSPLAAFLILSVAGLLVYWLVRRFRAGAP